MVSAGRSTCGGRSSQSWKGTARQTGCNSISSPVTRIKLPASLITRIALTRAGTWQPSPPTAPTPTAHAQEAARTVRRHCAVAPSLLQAFFYPEALQDADLKKDAKSFLLLAISGWIIASTSLPPGEERQRAI